MLKLAAEYGPLGLICLAFGWWIYRQDAKADAKDAKHDDRVDALELAHRTEREADRATHVAAITALGNQVQAGSAAIASNTATLGSLGEAARAQTRELERLVDLQRKVG